jgi:nucleotide-binding universal stress UspA family protein
MTFERILVPLDGTRRSASVVPYAVDLAKRFGSRVCLLAVQTGTQEPVHVAREERGAVGASRGEGDGLALRRYLDNLAEQFHEEALEVETEIRHGVAAPEILAAALEGRCDLIAMSTRSRRGLRRVVLGSVAEEVLRKSRLPVLLVTA